MIPNLADQRKLKPKMRSQHQAGSLALKTFARSRPRVHQIGLWNKTETRGLVDLCERAF